MLYVKPSEKARLLDPQVATLMELLQSALSGAVESPERNKLAEEVYAKLEALLPPPEDPKLGSDQLRIWAQIQNQQEMLEQAAAFLERLQEEVPDLQSRVEVQEESATKVEKLEAAMQMLSTRVQQLEDKTKVGLPCVIKNAPPVYSS